MRKPKLSPEIYAAFEASKAANEKYQQLAVQETERLKEQYLNRIAKVAGNKGWNTGRIWDIVIQQGHFYSKTIAVYFLVGREKKNSTRFDPSEVELLSMEEELEYEKNLKFHQRINQRK